MDRVGDVEGAGGGGVAPATEVGEAVDDVLKAHKQIVEARIKVDVLYSALGMTCVC